MKIIKKSQTNIHKNSDNCVAHEYPFEHPDINMAIIELTDRYPESGYVLNEICTEIAYVMSGDAEVVFKDGTQVSLTVGDAILLEPNEPYYWNGTCTLCIPCTPAWNPDQHKVVE